MQATSSHVTTTTSTIANPAFLADLNDATSGDFQASDATPSIETMRRPHLLVNRRKRATRRSIR